MRTFGLVLAALGVLAVAYRREIAMAMKFPVWRYSESVKAIPVTPPTYTFTPADLTEEWILAGTDQSIGEYLEAKEARERERRTLDEQLAHDEDTQRTALALQQRQAAEWAEREREREAKRLRDIGYELEAARLITDEQLALSEQRAKLLQPDQALWMGSGVAVIRDAGHFYGNGYFVP